MGFLINDISLHGQYRDAEAFRPALVEVMRIRSMVKRYGHELYCHRSLLSANVGHHLNMHRAIASLPRDAQRAVQSWLNQTGPFWEDERLHRDDEWLECDGEFVFDTAIGEAAWRSLGHGEARRLISFAPSNFTRNPLAVQWVRNGRSPTLIEVENHWTVDEAEAAAEAYAVAPDSWGAVQALSLARFTRLTIAANAFEPLHGHPFHSSAAERIIVLLRTLDRLRGCVDAAGNRTPEGHELFQNLFTGEKAWFTDSSHTEQVRFREEMTFRDPVDPSRDIFCPWHGKVKTPQYRIHFSYPVGPDEPMRVVYVGPKITKR